MRRPSRFSFAAVFFLIIAVFACAAPVYPGEKSGPPVKDFDEAWQLVKDRFYDKNTNGVNWDKLKAKYENDAKNAKTSGELSEVINRMLGELKTSHTHYYTRDEVEYYGLVGIFKGGALKDNLNKFFPEGQVTYTSIGIMTEEVEGGTFVRDVLDGGPGDKAGLKRGDEILSADGEPFREIGTFTGKAGKKVNLIVMFGPNPGDVKTVTVVPEAVKPDSEFYGAMKESARIIQVNAKKIGYIHVWSYAGGQYQDLLVEQYAAGKLKDADALVIDLRDGWGGASPEYLDIFYTKIPVITETNRDVKRSTLDTQWRKPVAMLINGGSRSGKEIIAYGFKKYGIGKLVGTRTAGYVMGGRPFFLSSGNLLYLAVVDVLVDGERLEGVGVSPDVEVAMPLQYTHGKDPQLDEAVRLLSR